MTLAKLCEEYQVELCLFDGANWHSSGFYNPDTNILAIDHNLAPEQQIQVALHELGHKDHTRSEYQNARLRCENEADRNMIHHLVKDAIESLDDPTEFDYLKFMSYYNLKTMTNEVMVKEEYFALME